MLKKGARNNKTFQCSLWDKEFSQNSCHFPYQCNQCHNAFSHKDSLMNHMRIHTGERPYQCNDCTSDKDFSNKINLIHTGEMYQCSHCAMTFFQSNTLTVHLMTHIKEKPHHCSKCNKVFYEKSHLINHMDIHTRERPYQCSQCHKDFLKEWHLKLHIRIHTEEKPYQCSQCVEAFICISSLQQHQLVHTKKTMAKINHWKCRYNFW